MPHLHSKKQGVIITRQPHMYFSVFTNLRHIHRGQIVCKSIFSFRDTTIFLASGQAITPFFGYCLCSFYALLCFLFCLTFVSIFIHLRQFWRYTCTDDSMRLHFLKKRSDAVTQESGLLHSR